MERVRNLVPPTALGKTRLAALVYAFVGVAPQLAQVSRDQPAVRQVGGVLAVFLLLVAFFAATLRLAEATFLLAVAFLAATLRLAVAFLAAVLRFAVDLFFAGDIGHPLSIGVRTPCASGVAVLVRSSLPTPRTARRGEGRS
jgi:hypothetical protein